jgi:hypothetical protein
MFNQTKLRLHAINAYLVNIRTRSRKQNAKIVERDSSVMSLDQKTAKIATPAHTSIKLKVLKVMIAKVVRTASTALQ